MSKRKSPNDNLIKKLYLDNELSSGQIAKKYNVARGSICRHLRRLGITRPESGPNSRNKKRIGEVMKNGYPVLHLPNHPRASAIGYVYKHILEMEKHIGRIPKKSEPIHHIDFDRMNYDIKNLYLCKSNSEHQQLHGKINVVIKRLIKGGTIRFKNGKYY